MVLDLACPICKLQNLKTSETKAFSLRFDDVADHRADTVVVEDHLDLFYAKLPRDDRPVTHLERRLKDDPLIRRCHSLHDGFTEAPSAVNNDSVAKTALGVEREHHA